MKLLFENWRKYIQEEEEVRPVPGVNTPLYYGLSPIHGEGIFAGEFIPAGTALGVSHVKKDIGYDITPLGAGHNHSYEPSCENILDGDTRTLYALSDIPKDREITIDYTKQQDLQQPEEGWA